MNKCPHCRKKILEPRGYQKSNTLIIKWEPHYDDIKKDRAFSAPADSILRQELLYKGISMSGCRLISFWLHSENKNEECYKDGLNRVIQEATGKQNILLIGSDVTQALTEYKVMEVCGLNVTSPYLSAPIIVPIISPGIAFGGTVGELRLAIKKFARYMNV